MTAQADPVFRLAHASEPAPRFVDIPLDDIFDGDRLRDIDPAWAAALAANFEAGGKPPPIEVRVPAPEEGIAQPYALVVGGHRKAAFRLLGRPSIKAEIRNLTRLQARLVEVEENLFRHELNALDRAVFLAEHERVWLELHPETEHGGDRRSRRAEDKIKSQGLRLDPRRFTFEAAERCGLSERTVQAALALVKALAPETIALLRGTDTARNAAELQRLAAEPADRQVSVAKLLRMGKASNVAAARIMAGVAPAGEDDPQEALFRNLVSNWARADRKTRLRFLQHAGLAEKTPRTPPLKVSEVVPELAAAGGGVTPARSTSKTPSPRPRRPSAGA